MVILFVRTSFVPRRCDSRFSPLRDTGLSLSVRSREENLSDAGAFQNRQQRQLSRTRDRLRDRALSRSPPVPGERLPRR